MQVLILGVPGSRAEAVGALLAAIGVSRPMRPLGVAAGLDVTSPHAALGAAFDSLVGRSDAAWWRLSRLVAFPAPASGGDPTKHLSRLVSALDRTRPWALEDPRLLGLLPLLRPLLDAPICVLVAADPLDAARSLHSDEAAPLQVGVAAWELATAAAIAGSQGLPRLTVAPHALETDPAGTAAGLMRTLTDLGVPGLRLPGPSEFDALLAAHLRCDDPPDIDAWQSLLTGHQLALAHALDAGEILDHPSPFTPSTAAVELVHWFEEASGGIHDADASKALVADLREREKAAINALRGAERRLEEVARSRSWRVARRAMDLRRRLRAGTSPRRGASVENALRALSRAREEIEQRRRQGDVAGVSGAPTVPGTPPLAIREPGKPRRRRTQRPRIAVLAWDIGHNCVGRAHILGDMLRADFDIEVWGPQFPKYGRELWAPLQGTAVAIRPFPGRPFPGHLAVMESVAREISADALYVSKPRMPSYGLGMLAKGIHPRPLVLDVDDHELSFFDEDRPLDVDEVRRLGKQSDVRIPHGETWTRVCEGVIGAADALTVSNVALQRRYGGLVVPHARDETLFDPDRYDRTQLRRRLGAEQGERLLLFGGTPRAHKGIEEVLAALNRLGDERYRLLVFGTRELASFRKRLGHLGRWLRPLPYCSIEDLPQVVGACDLACVLQEPGSAVSSYQVPAKLTDALAMQVPCLVRDVAPLRPLIDAGVVQVLDDGEPLEDRITRIFDAYDEATARSSAGRRVFLESFSYGAVRPRVTDLFEGLLDAPAPLPEALARVVSVQREMFSSRGRRGRMGAPAAGSRLGL